MHCSIYVNIVYVRLLYVCVALMTLLFKLVLTTNFVTRKNIVFSNIPVTKKFWRFAPENVLQVTEQDNVFIQLDVVSLLTGSFVLYTVPNLYLIYSTYNTPFIESGIVPFHIIINFRFFTSQKFFFQHTRATKNLWNEDQRRICWRKYVCEVNNHCCPNPAFAPNLSTCDMIFALFDTWS